MTMGDRAREAVLDRLGSVIFAVAVVLVCLLVGRFLGLAGLLALRQLRRGTR